ncbi:MAG: DUF2334 domain-containing protein [Romboutsia sp.]|uniref:DUF2334 domain-containing protein n=1 Tax=Romboutsia sp. TaxID=1965302 RepID=UPI003F3F1014
MKKKLLYLLGIILSLACLYGVIFYFSFFQGDAYIKDGLVHVNAVKKDGLDQYKPIQTDYKISLPEARPLSDVSFTILGTELPNTIKPLLYGKRYYLPINYISNLFNFTYQNKILKHKDITINLTNKTWLINEKSYNPRGILLNYNNIDYISLSDIEYLFNKTIIFDDEHKSIAILNSSLNKRDAKTLPLKDGKVALLRFEDVTAGSSFESTLSQAKFKAMADSLYKNNLRFNVTWIPRYVNPEKKIDNDLTTSDSFNNIGFINMLDYLINSNGQIGLHGYTHQAGDTSSAVGSELTKTDNSTDAETRKVIESAIYTANYLNIPVYFFESPHYHATANQKKIIGEYFQYQYEPYSILEYTALIQTSNGNLFIPTPLSYVKNRDVTPILKKLKSSPPNFLASMFYHPSLELDYITLSTNNNLFKPTFNESSILQKLIKGFKENDYITIHPTDFNN